MKKNKFKIIKWLFLLIAIILFVYRVFLVNNSKELKEKYYKGSGVFYDSSNEGIIISILAVVMFVVFLIFHALDDISKKKTN